ncbi:MAG: hypothetical protein IKK92_10010 [Prevotella sp.]|nr:hypothetical protein [Prevotella sp.]
MDLFLLETILCTAMIIVSGLVALFGVIFNTRLLSNNYRTIMEHAPNQRNIFVAHIFIIFALSGFTLLSLAYNVFLHSSMLGFAVCGAVSFIELFFLLRAIRLEKAYMVAINLRKQKERGR